MGKDFGKKLGEILAHFEEDLESDFHDLETLQRIQSISETCRNFAAAGIEDFAAEFEQGYQTEKEKLRVMVEREVAHAASTGPAFTNAS